MGDRLVNLRAALQRLAGIGKARKISSFYETEPVEVTDQPWFVNCVVALEFEGSPQDLLRHALRIEHEMGRQRSRAKGPRIVDLDVLLLGDCVVDDPGLTVPHPAMHLRRFVLEPLAEIAPDVVHPLFKKTVREMLAALPAGQAVRRLANITPVKAKSRIARAESHNPRAR